MNLSCKKNRQLTREEKTFRDDRLFIVASEDTYAVEAYFGLFRQESIKVKVLPTPEGKGSSSPEHVLDRLNEYFQEYELEPDDQLWLALDTDHWTEANHIANFDRVCSEALQKDYYLAHSNPCFEMWLLLHHEDVEPNEQFPRCADVVERLKNRLGEYSKRTLDPQHFGRHLAGKAIERAEALDEDSLAHRWPQKPGSHVYKLARELLGALAGTSGR